MYIQNYRCLLSKPIFTITIYLILPFCIVKFENKHKKTIIVQKNIFVNKIFKNNSNKINSDLFKV